MSHHRDDASESYGPVDECFVLHAITTAGMLLTAVVDAQLTGEGARERSWSGSDDDESQEMTLSGASSAAFIMHLQYYANHFSRTETFLLRDVARLLSSACRELERVHDDESLENLAGAGFCESIMILKRAAWACSNNRVTRCHLAPRWWRSAASVTIFGALCGGVGYAIRSAVSW